MISVQSSGPFKNTESFLNKNRKLNIRSILNSYGRQGVQALAAATPKDSGRASSAWSYVISNTRTGFSITWTNGDVEDGFPVAIMLQYGYATGTGGYVAGRDYINPAIKPIMDQIADQAWKEVTRG